VLEPDLKIIKSLSIPFSKFCRNCFSSHYFSIEKGVNFTNDLISAFKRIAKKNQLKLFPDGNKILLLKEKCFSSNCIFDKSALNVF
jgi:hypothetical protein